MTSDLTIHYLVISCVTRQLRRLQKINSQCIPIGPAGISYVTRHISYVTPLII